MPVAKVQEDLFQHGRPILKWAGGKTQLLPHILPKVPPKFGKYIEPFFGGGALFFALNRKSSIISDINPELINLYKSLAVNVGGIIERLRSFRVSEEEFYRIRGLDWQQIDPIDAAARTIFLNRTCYNGLYRVNKKGQFNVPYGHYNNPKLIDELSLYSAANLLKGTDILIGDYKSILNNYASEGDFIFIDPPYLPISKYSDFKRYTKEQFYEEDHADLFKEIERLHEIGCHVILTNSNHPFVHSNYSKYKIEVIQTKRYISSNGLGRIGEDVIVTILPKKKFNIRLIPQPISQQTLKFPTTRFMGSKQKLLAEIWSVASQFKFDTAIDLFSGSGIVGYMFKSYGKNVISNDYMTMSYVIAQSLIENNRITLNIDEAEQLLLKNHPTDGFVQNTFNGLYYSEEDNAQIDILRANIFAIKNKYKRSIALTALIRACLKKRPRGIFTYVGDRYNDGRKDISMSLQDQFLNAVKAVNGAIFDNGTQNRSRHGDSMTMTPPDNALVYIDPPYFSAYSDNEYVRRYHFVEGLARNWEGVEIQQHTVTKKFKSYPTPFSSKTGAISSFDTLFRRFQNNVLLVSYSSNCYPSLEQIIDTMTKYKSKVEVKSIDYKYSFGTQGHKIGNNNSSVTEYLFVGY